jgi:arylsulfatase A-like enzyme
VPATRQALAGLATLASFAAFAALPVRAAEPLPSCQGCNLVVIVVDTLRVDHLGYAGYSRDTSPAIDAFVADARRYDAAIAQATWTVPSTASLLCSAYPGTHRLQFGPGETDDWHGLGDGTTTLAEVLAEQGYATAALIGNPVLRPKLGLDRGFGRYELLDDEQAIAEAARQIALWGDDRFFLYLHLLGPHPGLDPPPPYDTLFGPPAGALPSGGLAYQHVRERDHATRAAWRDWYRNLYDGSIRYTDKLLGDLLALLRVTGVLDETVVVFTSDHGEHLFDHGLFGHGMSVFEPLAHVPLAIRVPGDEIAFEPELVEQVDLAPTFLQVLGVPEDPGRDWDGGPLGEGGVAFCEQGPREAIWRGRYKLIVDRSLGTESLHDLVLDPGETRDFGPQQPGLRSELGDQVRRWRAALGAGASTTPLTLDPDEIARLRALGYID